MKEALAEEAVRWRILFEHSRDGIVVLNQDFKVYNSNQSFADMLGYSLEEIHQLHVWDWDVQWTREEMLEKIPFTDTAGARIETRHRRKDGTIYDVEVSINGAVIRGEKLIFCVHRYIADRKLAEKNLQDTLRLTQTLIETIPCPIFFKDSQGIYLGCNQAFEAYLGLSRQEIIGRSVFDIAPDDLAEKYHSMDSELFHAPGKQVYESQVLYADGMRHDVIFNKATFLNADGSPAGLVGVMIDISERKRAERALRESEERYRLVFENAPLGIMHFDETSRVTDCNDKFAAIIGAPREKIIGFNMLLQLRDERFRDAVIAALEGKDGFVESDYLSVCGNKPSRLRALFQRIVPEDGGNMGAAAIFEDITERKQVEERIVQQNEFLNTVLESLPHPFYVVDADDYTVKMANSAAAPDGLPPGIACYELTHKETGPCQGSLHLCPLQAVKQTREPVIVEHIHYDKNGNARHVEVHAHPIFDRAGKVVHIIEYSLDITERKEAEERIRHLALHDPLTDLPNRNLLFDRLSHAIARAHRYRQIAAILYIDLDGFKPINDTFGHKTGDSVLAETAKRLKECIRETDTAARLGGDEFAVILQDLHEKVTIEEIAQRIVESLTRPFIHNGRSCLLRGVSIGISIYPWDAGDADTLLQEADQTMYAAKRSGRGGYLFYGSEEIATWNTTRPSSSE